MKSIAFGAKSIFSGDGDGRREGLAGGVEVMGENVVVDSLFGGEKIFGYGVADSLYIFPE